MSTPETPTAIRRVGRFTLPIAPGDAFELFTTEGERDWVGPHWDPVAVHPPDGPLVEGAVFTTTEPDGSPTLWRNQVCDRERGRLEYVRVTPGSRIGVVRVALEAVEGGTDVEIEYELVALSPSGRENLAAMTEAAYAATMDGWHRTLVDLIAARRTADVA